MGGEFIVSDLYFNPNVCHICKSTFKNIKKCSGCKMISYCSKEHQKLHWSSHKALCICLQGVKNQLGNYYYDLFKFSNESEIENQEVLFEELDKTTGYKEETSFKRSELDVGVRTLSLDHITNKSNNVVTEERLKNDDVEGKTSNEISTSSTHETVFKENLFQSTKLEKIISNTTKKEWIQYKFKFLSLVENILGRNLRNIEKEIVLKPKCCIVCKESHSELSTCETCFSVNYCDKHKNEGTHAYHCQQFTLLYKINKYIVDKYVTNSFVYIENISNFLEPYTFESELEHYELSEYTSFYRTLVHLIQFINFSNKSLTLHVVGASEYECSPYSIYLWENIFHRISFINNITISFVGFDVTSDQFQMRLCQNCFENHKTITIECHQMSYDSYIELHHKKDKSKVWSDLIIAYNAGFHEFENQPDTNTWTKTLEYILSTKKLPIAFTAYTKDEIHKDTQIIKNIAQAKESIDVQFMIESEVNAEASEKPRIDPEDGVYYLNKYITCFYCK